MNRVIIIGSQGSGKTTLAELLARAIIYHPTAQDSVKVSDPDSLGDVVFNEEMAFDTKGRIELTEIATVNGDAIPTVDSPYGLETTDAAKWADTYLVSCLGNPAIPYDKGSMIGWFANALMRGHDYAALKYGCSMDSEFHKDAMRTAAGPGVFHYGDGEDAVRIDVEFIEDAIAYLKAAARIDRWKSRLFYGKDKELPNFDELLSADLSLDHICNPQLVHGILGVATEGAELVESLLKLMKGDSWQDAEADDHGTSMNAIAKNIVEESGDVDWFQELIAEAIRVPVSGSRETVVNKLRKRYPEKFNSEDAVARKDEASGDA